MSFERDFMNDPFGGVGIKNGILEINLIKLETKMKNLKRILTLSILLVLVVEYSNAQEIVLNKYKFGEGLEFSGIDNNYKMEIVITSDT